MIETKLFLIKPKTERCTIPHYLLCQPKTECLQNRLIYGSLCLILFSPCNCLLGLKRLLRLKKVHSGDLHGYRLGADPVYLSDFDVNVVPSTMGIVPTTLQVSSSSGEFYIEY